MRLFILAFLIPTCLLATAYRGGEGPCPVPITSSDFVIQRKLHQSSFPIEKFVLLKTHPLMVTLTSTDQLGILRVDTQTPNFPAIAQKIESAVFQSPLRILRFPNLSLSPLPAWTESAIPILERDDATFGFLPASGEFIKITEKAVSPICQVKSSYQLGETSSKEHALLYDRVTSDKLEITHLHLEACTNIQTTSVALTAREQVRSVFQRGDHSLIQTDGKLIWNGPGTSEAFDIRAKKVFTLRSDRPQFLVLDNSGNLALLLPQRRLLSTFMKDVAEIGPNQFDFTFDGSRLFVTAAVIDPSRKGVFEFEIKTPL